LRDNPPYYWTHGTTRPLRRLDFIFYGHDSVFFERESEGSVWVARSSFKNAGKEFAGSVDILHSTQSSHKLAESSPVPYRTLQLHMYAGCASRII
jgi:hypothetical protein